MTLQERRNSVSSLGDLVEFLKELCADFRNNEDEWENGNLDSFLDALVTSAEELPGFYKNQGKEMPEQPDWKMIADLLLITRLHE